MTEYGWDVDEPWVEFTQEWYLDMFWMECSGEGANEPDDDVPNPARYKYVDVGDPIDMHDFGPSNMDYNYFEKLYTYRRPFEEVYVFINNIVDQMIVLEGEMNEKTLWTFSFVLQTSEADRHRRMGYEIIDQIYRRKLPPGPTMLFQNTLARIRYGEYQLAMDMMQQSRKQFPGYGRNVKLEDYLYKKIEERSQNRTNWAIAQCCVIGALFILGSRSAIMHWFRARY